MLREGETDGRSIEGDFVSEKDSEKDTDEVKVLIPRVRDIVQETVNDGEKEAISFETERVSVGDFDEEIETVSVLSRAERVHVSVASELRVRLSEGVVVYVFRVSERVSVREILSVGEKDGTSFERD